ncbi:MAG: ABC transporter permease [Christensenellaceae bacterium]|jgi:ABC-type antimicrobial peptide transport system permease subunit|nr:ABC transporter permease [Christensenellaceae bacterium]
MRWSDLIRLSLQNLWRRKTRSILTMIGVMIGTASIVVMVSIGIGINQGQIDALRESGQLTTIELYSNLYYSGNGGGGGGVAMVAVSEGDSVKEQKFDQNMLRKIAAIEHVSAVTPMLDIYQFQLRTGKYVSHNSLTAITPDALTALDIKLSEGGGFSQTPGDTIEVILGGGTLMNFRNEKSRTQSWDSVPEIDWLNAKYTLVYSDWNNVDSDGNPKTYEFKAKVVGMIPDNGNQSAYRMYTNIESVQRLIAKNKPAFKNSGIKTDQFPNGSVRVDDYMNVTEVQRKIRELGINAWSQMEWIEQMQEQTRSLQLMLGGIGAVAMLVAAISIMNTMLMSIYERTREIGVMKVLGCRMASIGWMFLSEAGFIGLGGGITGLGFSYGVGAIINVFLSTQGAMSGFRSVIPPYLAIGALGFAVLVGMLAGFYPSQRAMRLSALAAIRTE